MQAWLHAMQVLTRSARARAALATISASARKGRAIETKSALPAASTSSATATLLIRLLAMTGRSPTAPLIAAAKRTHTPLGTICWTVGIDDSCQPMPTLIASTPPSASARANAQRFVGACVDPGIRSAPEMRKMTGKSRPALARIARKTARGSRMRRSKSPPHASSRRLVIGERNWLIRYPSDAITSTASKPSSRARAAPRAKSPIVFADLALVERARRIRREARWHRRRRDRLQTERRRRARSGRRERAAARCGRPPRARRAPRRARSGRARAGSLTKL